MSKAVLLLVDSVAAAGAEILQPMGPPHKGVGQWQSQLRRQCLSELGSADMVGLGHMAMAALGRAGLRRFKGYMESRSYEDRAVRARRRLLARLSFDDGPRRHPPTGFAIPPLARRLGGDAAAQASG